MSEEEAKEKAHEKVLWTIKKNFFDQYATFVWHTIHLENDETHQDILLEVEEKMEKGVNVRRAIKRVIGKHKPEFEELFLYESEDEDEDASEEDMDSVSGNE